MLQLKAPPLVSWCTGAREWSGLSCVQICSVMFGYWPAPPQPQSLTVMSLSLQDVLQGEAGLSVGLVTR